MFLRSVGSGVESGPVRSWSLIRIGLGTDLDLFDPFFFRSWHWSWSFWSDLRLAQNRSGPVLIRSGLWSDLFLIRRSPKHRKKILGRPNKIFRSGVRLNSSPRPGYCNDSLKFPMAATGVVFKKTLKLEKKLKIFNIFKIFKKSKKIFKKQSVFFPKIRRNPRIFDRFLNMFWFFENSGFCFCSNCFEF